jgi:Ankyrin repeats (many copies)/Ankyrin repeat
VPGRLSILVVKKPSLASQPCVFVPKAIENFRSQAVAKPLLKEMAVVVKEERLGDPLRLEWQPPTQAFTTARDALARMSETDEIRAQRKAAALTRVAASNVPYHPLVLAGKYHTYRIEAKYAVPGGVIQDDKRRQGAYDITLTSIVEDAAKMRKEMERQAEAAGIAAELTALRQSRVLPARDEDVLPGVYREQLEEEDTNWMLIKDRHVPEHEPIHLFPAGENDMFIFKMIKDNDLDGIRTILGRRDMALDIAEPKTMRTPLMSACLYGRKEMVEVFLKAGAAVNKRSDTGNTALQYTFEIAKRFSDFPDARKAGERKREFVVPQQILGITRSRSVFSLFFTCLLAVNEIVQMLIKHGAEVNCYNVRKNTPLHEACELGLATCVHMLMTAGASPTAKRYDGKTPIEVAYQCKREGAWAVQLILANWDKMQFEKKMFEVTRDLAIRAAYAHGSSEEERIATMIKEHQTKFDPTKGAVGANATIKAADQTIADGLRPDPHLEKKLDAKALIARWNLYSRWTDHRKAHGHETENNSKPSGADAFEAMRARLGGDLAHAEYDVHTGKLKMVKAPEAGQGAMFTEGGTVSAAKDAVKGAKAGRHFAWFRFGKEGHDMLRKMEQTQTEENDDASVDGVADGPDLEGSMNTKRRAFKTKPKKFQKKTESGWDMRNQEEGFEASEKGQIRKNAYRPGTSHGLAIKATLQNANTLVQSTAVDPGHALSVLQADPKDLNGDINGGLLGYKGGALGAMLTNGDSDDEGGGAPRRRIGGAELDFGPAAIRDQGHSIMPGFGSEHVGGAVPWTVEETQAYLGIKSTHNPFSLSLFTGAQMSALPAIGPPPKTKTKFDEEVHGVEMDPLMAGGSDDIPAYVAKAKANQRKLARRKWNEHVIACDNDQDPASAMYSGVMEFAKTLGQMNGPPMVKGDGGSPGSKKGAKSPGSPPGSPLGRTPSKSSRAMMASTKDDKTTSLDTGEFTPSTKSKKRLQSASSAGGSIHAAPSEIGTATSFNATQPSIFSEKSVDPPAVSTALRRQNIARQLLDDAPGRDYARRFTHIVDEHVVSRRPAAMSGLLRASRFRLDGRKFAEQAQGSEDQVMNIEALQRLVVGTTATSAREGTKVSAFDFEVLRAPVR